MPAELDELMMQGFDVSLTPHLSGGWRCRAVLRGDPPQTFEYVAADKDEAAREVRDSIRRAGVQPLSSPEERRLERMGRIEASNRASQHG